MNIIHYKNGSRFLPSFWNLVIFAILILPSHLALSAQFDITLIDRDNQSLAGIVVYLEPMSAQASYHQANQEIAQMSQKDRQFMPHILVVQKGAQVQFPNRDDIKHHVYSFSETKQFELKLYNGVEHTPVVFDKVGTVDLGCNVHDWMLGYIKVVDTPYYTKTNSQGIATLEVPDNASYQLQIWHPRIQNSQQGVSQAIEIKSNLSMTYQIQDPLAVAPDAYEQFDQDDDYQ